MHSITQTCWKSGLFLVSLFNFLKPPTLLYLYKIHFRPTMKQCCHIWTRYSISSRKRVQMSLRSLLGNKYFYLTSPFLKMKQRQTLANLSLFDTKCSFSHPPVQILRARTQQSIYTAPSHPHTLYISFLKAKFHSDNVVSRTVLLSNRPLKGCFPQHDHLNICKSSDYRCLSDISS